ncbi:uncharacterized protein LOC134239540 [Saccostrea cucullata]|uniref:uncharacterized protein LOC134239540 n=1 Tax=Saccostrea cuccullata TaxID=36930 RepID=UPI002ED2F039
MKNSLEHLLIFSVFILFLSFTFANESSQTENSISQLSKLFSNLQEIHGTKHNQEENTRDRLRSDTRKQRSEIGLILALGTPVNMESMVDSDKVLEEDKHTDDLDKSDWDIDFDDEEQEVNKRQGAWDYEYGLGGGRFGKRFDYSFGGGRWGRDTDHVQQENSD